MKAHIAIIIASLAVMTSCEKMFKPKTVGEVENDVMWTVPDMAKGVLMGVYNDIPKRFDSFSGNYLDAATDNAVTNSFAEGIYQLGLGGVSSTNNPLGVWSTCYNEFQNIHLFLENGLTEIQDMSRKTKRANWQRRTT